MDIKFEPTISLGTILQALVFVGTVMVAYTKFVARMTKIETKVNILWSAWSRTQGITTRAEDAKFFQEGQ